MNIVRRPLLAPIFAMQTWCTPSAYPYVRKRLHSSSISMYIENFVHQIQSTSGYKAQTRRVQLSM